MLRLTLALLLAASPALAQSDLIAIDVLLEPDATMLAAAQDWNTRLREQMPEGFELDATHTPHITLIQTFVATSDLDAVLSAVADATANLGAAGLPLEATGLYHIQGVQGIVIAPTPDLLAIQAAVIAAVQPFQKSKGDESAFVPDPSGTPFDPLLFDYVDTFIADRTGSNYNPHVSTGVGPEDWLLAREAEPFDHFTFTAAGLATYQLGNFGTAALRLDQN